jgi:hypothetical protein
LALTRHWWVALEVEDAELCVEGFDEARSWSSGNSSKKSKWMGSLALFEVHSLVAGMAGIGMTVRASGREVQ